MAETDKQKTGFTFQGFDAPRFTQVPDQLFDELLAELTDAELRVLLYIIRRTFGWKKDTDDISLNQMVNGITTKDGRVIDRGAGLSKSGAAKALQGLQAKQIIVSQRNRSFDRGDEPTTYQLRFKAHPLSTTWTGGSPPRGQAGVHHVDTQHTVLQETLEQHTDLSSKDQFSKIDYSKENAAQQRVEELDQQGSAQQVENPGGRGDRSQEQSHRGGMASVSEVLARRRSPLEDPEEEPVVPTPRRGRPFKAPEQIAALIEQWSHELHDSEHVKSNITRAAGLYRASGLSEDAFVGRLYEARSITKQQGNIKKRASSAGTLRNRMPYFFAVVEDLVGLKDEEAPRAPGSPAPPQPTKGAYMQPPTQSTDYRGGQYGHLLQRASSADRDDDET